MPRDYSSIEKEVIENGFFSEYLPPCFKINGDFFKKVPKKSCDLIAPYSFSMSRYNKNNGRRNIFIPEIGSYSVVGEFIKEKKILKDLIEFTENNEKSFSPILGKNDTLIRHEQSYDDFVLDNEDRISDYVDNIAKKIIRAAGAKKVLKLDISNCFSSFYTHMIPVILLGLDKAEENYIKWNQMDSQIDFQMDSQIDEQYRVYSELDKVVRKQNLNRTNGLLVGPIFSKIIMEAFLTRIDKELDENNIKFSRYVDDYEVYVYDDEEKQLEGLFVKILYKYGFSLNYEKKEILDFPYYVVENLQDLFQKYTDATGEELTDYELMRLFNKFLTLERDGINGAVRYLLKTLAVSSVIPVNRSLYKAYLLTILANDERSLTKVCSLLINDYHSLLDDKDILFIMEMLELHIERGNDLEVIWLLYVLIKTDNLIQDNKVVDSIVNTQNELAHVMLLRLAREKLTDKNLERIKENAISWILLYELYAENVITEDEFTRRLNLKENMIMYKHLRTKKLHFCNDVN